MRKRDVLSADTNYEVIRTPAPALTGKSLEEADVRRKTGCTVVAVERNGTLVTDLKVDFKLSRKIS